MTRLNSFAPAGTPLRARAAGASSKKAASIRAPAGDAWSHRLAALDSGKGTRRNHRVRRRDSRALRAATAHGRWRLRHLAARPGHRVSVGGGGRRCSAADHSRSSRSRSARQHAATVVVLPPLGARSPRYAHVPVLVDRSGQKLSKQTRATAVDVGSPTDNLWLILSLLGHEPPNALRRAEPTELLAWVTAQWDLARIPPRATHTRFVCI